jgi:four helix bundle protein
MKVEGGRWKVEGYERHDFDFENLEVYQRSLDFVNRIFTMCDRFPVAIDRTVGDQLRRATLSIPNNIAEGSNKATGRAKAQFYAYSLDSARECVPMLTIALQRRLISDDDHQALRGQCLSICKMLRRLIQSTGQT